MVILKLFEVVSEHIIYAYAWLFGCTSRGGTPILRHGREVPRWWPPFWGFPFWGPPLSAEKIGLSLSHLVPEILGPKFGIIFLQNLLFNRFYVFCINFLLYFRSKLPPFSLILNLFDPHFHKTLYLIGSKLFLGAEPRYRKFDMSNLPSSLRVRMLLAYWDIPRVYLQNLL